MLATLSLLAAAGVAFAWIRIRHKRKASGGAH
jgi:hypothetical protein